MYRPRAGHKNIFGHKKALIYWNQVALLHLMQISNTLQWIDVTFKLHKLNKRIEKRTVLWVDFMRP